MEQAALPQSELGKLHCADFGWLLNPSSRFLLCLPFALRFPLWEPACSLLLVAAPAVVTPPSLPPQLESFATLVRAKPELGLAQLTRQPPCRSAARVGSPRELAPPYFSRLGRHKIWQPSKRASQFVFMFCAISGYFAQRACLQSTSAAAPQRDFKLLWDEQQPGPWPPPSQCYTWLPAHLKASVGRQ